MMEYRRPARPKTVLTNKQLALKPGLYKYERVLTFGFFSDVYRKSRYEGDARASLTCEVAADSTVYLTVDASDSALKVSASRTCHTAAILDGFLLPEAFTFGRAADLVDECIAAFVAEASEQQGQGHGQ